MKVYGEREGHLSFEQEEELVDLLRADPLGTTDAIRALIEDKWAIRYSRSGCIKLLHRLGFSYKKPKKLPLQADEAKQQVFIENYRHIRQNLGEDEAVYFCDAVHPNHEVRPAHGWFHKQDQVVVKANSGRGRMNIHGVLNLETFDAPFVEAPRIDAKSTLDLLERLENRNPDKKTIHVFMDNARYHHARVVTAWLERPQCRIRLHFLPAYAPHLNPIERLWGVMHQQVTHNKFYRTYREFCDAITAFLKETIPKNWKSFRDRVTDNFRIITADKTKIIAG